jgi:hypothetical protein
MPGACHWDFGYQEHRMSFAKQVWQTLSAINVNDHTERKANLTYLSWSWAWATLMNHYPESTFEFSEPVIYPDGTNEIRVTVCVTEGDQTLVRTCWLPVMDHRNNAIPNPDARKVSDTKMRCLVKCLALFGLGHYIYAGEDIPEAEKETVKATINKLQTVADYIKAAIARDDDHAVLEAWLELTEEEMAQIWRAETKGGFFSQAEKTYIREARHRAYQATEGEAA